MTLLMRDQENLEKGIEKGIEKGKIFGMIEAFREMNLEEDVIIQKLRKKYQLSEEEANGYLQEVK